LSCAHRAAFISRYGAGHPHCRGVFGGRSITPASASPWLGRWVSRSSTSGTTRAGIPSPTAAAFHWSRLTRLRLRAPGLGAELAAFEPPRWLSRQLLIRPRRQQCLAPPCLQANSLRLAWPASSGAFNLWSAASPKAPAGWTRLTDPPVLLGDRWVVTLPVTNRASFYRLQGQPASLH